MGRILHFSDVHLNTSLEMDAYGKDSSKYLVDSALKFAASLGAFDIVLFNGDHVVHHWNQYNDQQVYDVIERNVHSMAQAFEGNKTISSVIGNTDTPADYQLDAHASILKKLVPIWWSNEHVDAVHDFKKGGYGVHCITPNELYVITLNTIIYSPNHTPKMTESDPFGQFKWLNATLLKLKLNNSKVYLVGHIPPILDSYQQKPQWQHRYVMEYQRIVQLYKGTIVIQWFGHVHNHEVRIPIKDTNMPPIVTIGSISPLFGNNPSFTIWEFNDDRGKQIQDFQVYGSNLTHGGASHWQLLFTGKEAYQLDKAFSSPALLSWYNTQTQYDFEQYEFRKTSMRHWPVNISYQAISCNQQWLLTPESLTHCMQEPENTNIPCRWFIFVSIVLTVLYTLLRKSKNKPESSPLLSK